MTIKEIVGEDKYDVNEIKSWFYVDEDHAEYDSYYEVFGIDDLYVGVPLSCEKDIIAGLDRIRKENKLLPLFYNDEDPDEIDYDSWYEIHLTVHQNHNVEMCFWVDGFTNSSVTEIDLSDEEKEQLYKIVKLHCVEETGEDLEKIFAEEEKNLKEYYESHSEGEAKDAYLDYDFCAV